MKLATSSKRAIVLLSGGLDSTTTLYYALKQGFKPLCLVFDYGQRHKREIESAKRIAKKAQCPYKIINLNLSSQGCSLLDKKVNLPAARREDFQRRRKIPSTYVPARNLIFLSIASSFAESLKAAAIFIGANALDYSGYPDCRPQFYTAFKKTLALGTRCGSEDKPIKIFTPLIKKSKKEIVQLAAKLKVPLELTWSCYEGGRRPCGVCESCFLRQKGFVQARIKDPLLN